VAKVALADDPQQLRSRGYWRARARQARAKNRRKKVKVLLPSKIDLKSGASGKNFRRLPIFKWKEGRRSIIKSCIFVHRSSYNKINI
jgi:hypothetical protein